MLVTIQRALRRAIESRHLDAVLDTLAHRPPRAVAWGPGQAVIAVAELSHAPAGRPLRRRGGPDHRAGDRREGRRHRRAQPVRAGHGVHAGPGTRQTSWQFDLVVAMTHDRSRSVPRHRRRRERDPRPALRAQADHGTAFDIAGRGTADPASLLAALRNSGAPAGGAQWIVEGAVVGAARSARRVAAAGVVASGRGELAPRARRRASSR